MPRLEKGELPRGPCAAPAAAAARLQAIAAYLRRCHENLFQKLRTRSAGASGAFPPAMDADVAGLDHRLDQLPAAKQGMM